MFDFTDALDAAHNLAQFMISQDLVDNSGEVLGTCCFARLVRKPGQVSSFCVELDVRALDIQRRWGDALTARGYAFVCALNVSDKLDDMDEYIKSDPVVLDLPDRLDHAAWKAWEVKAAALFNDEMDNLLSMLAESGVYAKIKQQRTVAA